MRVERELLELKDKLNQIDRFKQAMGDYPTGVTVVTAFDENNKPMGLTVNSFASVSLEPLLILWSIDEALVHTKISENRKVRC